MHIIVLKRVYLHTISKVIVETFIYVNILKSVCIWNGDVWMKFRLFILIIEPILFMLSIRIT